MRGRLKLGRCRPAVLVGNEEAQNKGRLALACGRAQASMRTARGLVRRMVPCWRAGAFAALNPRWPHGSKAGAPSCCRFPYPVLAPLIVTSQPSPHTTPGYPA
jgi:hypothetical protein